MSQMIRSVKGTRDFYPEEMASRQWLIDSLRLTSQSFGFQAYDGPCLEAVDLYAAKSGEELVKEQAFVFPDRGGELITLRPELTPTLARMVAQKQNELVFPLRWWSFGPFWRYERPQKGRTREFFQWNVDLIGSDSVLADAELIAVAASFFRQVGLNPDQVQILVNDRRLMDAVMQSIGVQPDQKAEMLHLMDRLDKLPAEVWDEKVRALGLSPMQLSEIHAILSDNNLWERSNDLRALFEALEGLGVQDFVRFSPKIIRGLDYYTGTVFEAHETSGEFRAVLGGGHYANLVSDVGGRPLPGVGFAMGDVVIMLVLQKYGLLPQSDWGNPRIFVSVFDESTLAASLGLANELRQAGLEVLIPAEIEKLAKQLKFADRIGVRMAIVLGPDEISQGRVTIKDLKSGVQDSVSRGATATWLKAHLAER